MRKGQIHPHYRDTYILQGIASKSKYLNPTCKSNLPLVMLLETRINFTLKHQQMINKFLRREHVYLFEHIPNWNKLG